MPRPGQTGQGAPLLAELRPMSMPRLRPRRNPGGQMVRLLLGLPWGWGLPSPAKIRAGQGGGYLTLIQSTPVFFKLHAGGRRGYSDPYDAGVTSTFDLRDTSGHLQEPSFSSRGIRLPLASEARVLRRPGRSTAS